VSWRRKSRPLFTSTVVHQHETAVNLRRVGYATRNQELQRGVDIVVATPGRLLDLLGQGSLHLRDVNLLVLDEVDRMPRHGFLPDVAQDHRSLSRTAANAGCSRRLFPRRSARSLAPGCAHPRRLKSARIVLPPRRSPACLVTPGRDQPEVSTPCGMLQARISTVCSSSRAPTRRA